MIGIVGQGFVGNAVYQKFKNYYDVLTHDKDDGKSTSTLDNMVHLCDCIFLCLPTPMKSDGRCDTSILESVLDAIQLITDDYEFGVTKRTIVIKSTISPGTTEKWNGKYKNLQIVFQLP